MSEKTKRLTGRKRKRFNKKYNKYIREKRDIPRVNKGIQSMKELIEEMKPYKRPLWGYRWKKAAAAKKK